MYKIILPIILVELLLLASCASPSKPQTVDSRDSLHLTKIDSITIHNLYCQKNEINKISQTKFHPPTIALKDSQFVKTHSAFVLDPLTKASTLQTVITAYPKKYTPRFATGIVQTQCKFEVISQDTFRVCGITYNNTLTPSVSSTIVDSVFRSSDSTLIGTITLPILFPSTTTQQTVPSYRRGFIDTRVSNTFQTSGDLFHNNSINGIYFNATDAILIRTGKYFIRDTVI